ncbi:MAG: AAA family ATPase [Chloroflexota bacterium]
MRESELLKPGAVKSLVNQLSVATRRLDFSASRPNAVVLLTGAAARNSRQLSEVLAGALFGSTERVVEIDFSRMIQSHDTTMLIGASPGYVGYSNALPIHTLLQMPWSVLLCENVQATHPAVLGILTQALATGVMNDAQGKKIYLSDTVVVLTAPSDAPNESGAVSLSGGREQESSLSTVSELLRGGGLDVRLLDQCDLVCHQVPDNAGSLRAWVTKQFLPELADRYRKHGVQISWHLSIVDWLLSGTEPTTRSTVRLKVDRVMNPAIMPYLPARLRDVRKLSVSYDGQIIVSQGK